MSKTENRIELPPIITLEEYSGDIVNYLEAVYTIFRRDFVDSKPKYRNKRLGLKKYPLISDKEYTFYHMTHKGNIETERTPDLRRCERIAYPKPLIENSISTSLKVWKNKRGTKVRILIFHEEESYLVVLEDRGSYILPWTAYIVEYKNKKQRLLKEYEAYINAETAHG